MYCRTLTIASSLSRPAKPCIGESEATEPFLTVLNKSVLSWCQACPAPFNAGASWVHPLAPLWAACDPVLQPGLRDRRHNSVGRFSVLGRSGL